MENFNSFKLSENLTKSLKGLRFTKPTEVQAKTISLAIDKEDILASAETGSGKTAAYLIPLIQQIATNRKVSGLVLAPTRELAQQVADVAKLLVGYKSGINISLLVGGASITNQLSQLKKYPRIIIGTPGRINDHLLRKSLNLRHFNFLVLDEADRMLDMGFYDDILSISKKIPKKRQTLLFSATMPSKIRKLAENILINPSSISLAISKPAEGIKQSAYLINDDQKIRLIRDILKEKEREKPLSHVLIFASSIKSVKEIKRTLNKSGLRSSDMHSELNQEQREDTIRDFKNKKIKILVATDILSRGIDIKGIELVMNYEVPHDAEDYVHRIGRTARADRTGEAITFINQKQVKNFMDIETLIEKSVIKNNLPENYEKGPKFEIFKKNNKKKNWKRKK